MATDVRPRLTSPSVPPERPGRSWPERIASALPGAFLAVVFGFFFITKTSEAWSATKSAQALLVIGGIVAGWVILGWLLRRFVRWVWIRSAMLSAIAVAIAVVIVRPGAGPSPCRSPTPPRPRPEDSAGWGITCARQELTDTEQY